MTDSYTTPGDLNETEQSALEELLFRLADDEYVAAERYVEWQIFAPTLESDLALANIAQDEYGHARLWYDLLQEFGYREADLLWERDPADFRHATLVEQPFAEGDWGDAVVRSYLYDTAEILRLEALTDTSYEPLADRVPKAIDEESYHREHAQSWLERLTVGTDDTESAESADAVGASEDAPDRDAHRKVQGALDRLFPHALTLFEPGEYAEEIVAFGFQTETLGEMRDQWLDTTIPYLESLGLTVPDPADAERPTARGRDGSHTDAWFDLHAEFTATYHELNFDEPTRLRGEEA
ncbi:1,2-phenylacetyl-CoA epoxidase subunit PaaC [Salinirubrum litoreum]|uniref:1,2-phenylacetyl-CoA epoxidase subunit PaaC n=1 Tax=Salinirubrum litoreum TaxID=1126234 RepID=A0ABD5R8F9_9EURY